MTKYMIPVFLSLVSVNSEALVWDGFNNPANMESDFVYNYEKLPKKGQLPDPLPWSETYWPAQKGSVNIRWNSESKQGFGYRPYSKEAILKMSPDEIAKLSPTEKYDLAMGRYDYPLWWQATAWADPKAKDWNGICDGWAVAAISFTEPNAVEITNPDGVKVRFGASDVKGIMSLAATSSYFKIESTGQIGSRCWKAGGIFRNWDCEDINAGALHVVMANMIGLRKEALIFDRDPGPEIWNQPVFGFEFTELGSAEPEPGAAKAIQIHGSIHFTDELDDPQWEPVTGTPKFAWTTIEMDYIIEMDEAGNVVGGRWLKGSDHPDFVWVPKNKLVFSGYFAGINAIYRPVK